jgi:hypothetical protein
LSDAEHRQDQQNKPMHNPEVGAFPPQLEETQAEQG